MHNPTTLKIRPHRQDFICCVVEYSEGKFTLEQTKKAQMRCTGIQGVSGGIVNILGGGSMDYSE